MFTKVYKLRELFPVLCNKDIETLKKERHEYLLEHPWASPEYWEPTLAAYCPDVSREIDLNRKNLTVLICPGGGYEFCSDREAEPVALQFAAMGYNAFVLRYECAPQRYPQQLLEAAGSLAFIRRNAEKFHVDPEKILICGFSAGAHLAASLGTSFEEKFIAETLGLKEGEAKPNGMILGYPVITSGEFAHRGSFEALLGDKSNDEEILTKVSLEKQVKTTTPPAFIWQTFEDGCVPVENSLLFATALRKKNIPFEYHVFPKGDHGLSLATWQTAGKDNQLNAHDSNWMNLCREWLEVQF